MKMYFSPGFSVSSIATCANITLAFLLDFFTLAALQKDPDLRSLSESFWNWKLREFPELATREHFHQYDDLLESYSFETFENRKNNCSRFLELANRIDEHNLCREDFVTLEVLKDQLTKFTEGYRWKYYGNLNPVSFIEGIHLSLSWVTAGQFNTQEHYDKYIHRLQTIPRQIDEIIALMREAIQLHKTSNMVSVRQVPSQLETITNVPPEDTIFYEPFLTTLNNSSLSSLVRDSLKREGRNTIQQYVQPAFQKLKVFISEEYFPHTRRSYGVSCLENGDEYYRDILRWHLSLDMEPMDVHRIGLAEVERITGQMEKVMNQLDFYGDLHAFFRSLESQRRFYNHTGEQLLEKYRHIIYRRINPRLPTLFGNMSAVPHIRVNAIPRDGVTAYYMDSELYVNINRAEERASFTIMAVSLHEANPGHHYQVSLALKLPFPNFRRFIWPRKYSAPFHFPYYTAYVEGWGLYAEYLGEELGLYDDPYELFGRYTFEMFRACRLVVDTGIHILGWTRKEAVDYLRNHTVFTQKEAEIEIDRYITWPGQACAYKIGELELKKLRNLAQNRLGSKFDVKEFHWNVIKVGFVPLQLLKRSIEMWIEQKLQLVNAAPVVSSCQCILTRTIVLPVLIVVLLVPWIVHG